MQAGDCDRVHGVLGLGNRVRVRCDSRGVLVQDLTRTESTPAAEVVDWERVVEVGMGRLEEA